MKNETKKSMERIFLPLAKHPFLSVTGMCLLLFFFGFCESSGLKGFSYFYAGAVMLAAYILLAVFGGICKGIKQSVIVVATVMTLTAGGLFLMYSFDNNSVILLWLSLVLLAVLSEVLWLTNSLDERSLIMMIIAAGVMLRIAYCLYTPWQDRQHDIGYFNWTWGHANYIEYWRDNGLKLPDFDVRSKFQYYQAPLHHMLMGYFMKLLESCGMENAQACNALQFLPFLYSSLFTVVSCRIFRMVKLKGLPMIIASAILCLHPAFVLLGGSFNNDMLSILMMLFSVMFALRWYKQPTLKRIIPVALSIGLGMMAKLSASLVAPATAILFLYVFIKNIKKWKGFLGQFAVFGVICAPLGLWWGIRNYILFKVPINYVPVMADEAHPQYCGDMSVFERLFKFGGGQLKYVYPAFTEHGAPYDEFNPTIGLIKTAIFDEGDRGISTVNFPQIAVTGTVLFWIGVALALLCFVCFIMSMLSKKSGLSGITRVYFAVMALTLLGSYYKYCFDYPFSCTMNIRFCAPLIPLFIIGLGLTLKRFSGDRTPQKVFRGAVCVLSAAFVVMVCLVFSQIALPLT